MTPAVMNTPGHHYLYRMRDHTNNRNKVIQSWYDPESSIAVVFIVGHVSATQTRDKSDAAASDLTNGLCRVDIILFVYIGLSNVATVSIGLLFHYYYKYGSREKVTPQRIGNIER